MSEVRAIFITVHDALKTLDGQCCVFLRLSITVNQSTLPKSSGDRDQSQISGRTTNNHFLGDCDASQLQDFKDRFAATMDEDFNPLPTQASQ